VENGRVRLNERRGHHRRQPALAAAQGHLGRRRRGHTLGQDGPHGRFVGGGDVDHLAGELGVFLRDGLAEAQQRRLGRVQRFRVGHRPRFVRDDVNASGISRCARRFGQVGQRVKGRCYRRAPQKENVVLADGAARQKAGRTPFRQQDSG
jgi:hypothetical protein